jgi:hypothetical protein
LGSESFPERTIVPERRCPDIAERSRFGTMPENRREFAMSQISTGLPEEVDTMPDASRAWVAISPALDPSIEIVVCIPSFRRPQHLRQTLQSLAGQRSGRRFAVVIVENDALRTESDWSPRNSSPRANFRGSASLSRTRAIVMRSTPRSKPRW